MSIQILERYLPPNTLPYLRKWFGSYAIHIKITKERQNKLGDYLKLRDGSHQITINSTLPPQLFFFVLTHEMAHLLAFEKYGRRIQPHGTEWKHTYREMLLESIEIYEEMLRPAVIHYAKNPKANFMSSPDLVRYLDTFSEKDHLFYVENLQPGEQFIYRGRRYVVEARLKKNYLCVQVDSGRRFTFKPLSRVEKI